MKALKKRIPLLAASLLAVALAACGGAPQGAPGTSAPAGEIPSVAAVAASGPSEDLDALFAEENAVFSEHADVWGRVLDSIPREKAAAIDSIGYANLLRESIEALAGSFTEEEERILCEDLQKIEAIEQKIQNMEGAK